MRTFELAAELLGGAAVLGELPRDPVAAAEMIRTGLPSRTVKSLRAKLDATLDELAQALRVPKRMLGQGRSQRLNAIQSERVYRLARITALAIEALGDLEKARRWLRAENRALAGEKPMLLVDTDVGAAAVEDVLTRIEYGVLS